MLSIALLTNSEVGGMFTMPEWWLELFGAMVGGVWGVSALKNTMPASVNGVVKAVRKK